MKILVQRFFPLLCLTVLPACAQIKYPAKITVQVVDDTGTPITSGKVRVSTFANWVRGEGFGYDEHDNFEVSLTEKGAAIVEMHCLRSDIGYWPILDGRYYSGGGGNYLFKEVINGRWEPWNPQLEIVVPRILNPIPLHARRLGFGPNVELPTMGPVGFDLVVSDWVAPYGKGARADFIFECKTVTPVTDPTRAFESFMTLTFANIGDGIQSRLARPTKRLLEMPRQAPEEGYEASLTKRVARAGKGVPIETGTREDQNYFFRVRTVLDPKGKVISALYGKIHGDIVYDVINSPKGYVQFIYYVNPKPLDRNLEFDSKRNLFPDTLSGTNGLEP